MARVSVRRLGALDGGVGGIEAQVDAMRHCDPSGAVGLPRATHRRRPHLVVALAWFVFGLGSGTIGQSAPGVEVPSEPFVQTIAGSGRPGALDAPAGAASTAEFYRPEGIAVDPAGNIVLADTENRLIRRIVPDGSVTTIAGSRIFRGFSDGVGTNAAFGGPSSVAVDGDGVVYVADSSYHLVRRIAPDGTVTTVAGQLGSSGFADGKGSAVRFNIPAGVAVDAQRNVYIADRLNHVIRRMDPGGEVRRFAGQAQAAGFRDGPEQVALFYGPTAVAVGGDRVFVADTGNNAIRRIEPDGSVTTIAGFRGRAGYRDGTPLESAFNYPRGLAVDAAGDVYVADTANQVVRKILAGGGEVRTVAGLHDQIGHYDGTGESARFNELRGIAVAPDGTIVVADTWNHQVRRLRPSAPVGRFTVDAPVELPGVSRHVEFVPETGNWVWSWLNQPPDSATPLPAPGGTNFTILPDVPGLYTLRASVPGDSAMPGSRNLDLLAVPARQLGIPAFTQEGRVRLFVGGGPGLAARLEGYFSGSWLALTNRAVPDADATIEDPLPRDPVARFYRVRYLAAP